MEKLLLTTPVQTPENPVAQYKLLVSYDHNNSDEQEFLFTTADEALKYKAVYDDYMKRLAANWNGWCNLEGAQVERLFDENGLEDIDIYEQWLSDENFFYAVTSTKITFFDENGVEWNTTEY